MTVYSASKAYVSAFSRGLGEELKGTGITVTAVCSGPMATEFLDVAGITGKSKTFEVLPYCDPPTTVAFCTHNLVFCIGTVLHHTSRCGERVTLSASGGERPTLCLTCEGVAETRERAAARFGLDREGRLPILLSIAENSDFSLTLAGGDEAKLLFHLPRYRAETYRVYALTAHPLQAAFTLPLSYFHYE
jgi:hypothetical protein